MEIQPITEETCEHITVSKSPINILIVTRLGRLRLATVDGPPPKEFVSPTGRLFKRVRWGRMDTESVQGIVEMYIEAEK